MAYQFRLTRKPGYLHVRVTGDNTEETVMGYLKDVLEACRKNDCPHVLIEENLEGPGLGLAEIYGVVGEGSRKIWPIIQRVAYVDVNPAHDRGNLQFAETAAKNRSVNMRLFRTVAEAEAWIGGPPPGSTPA
jgi:hypothetical protein